MASLSHRQGWSFAVLLAVFPCVFFASATNDAPTVTYRASTSEVRVAFFATDQTNRLVEAIDRNDFAVVDGEAVIRDFRSLMRSEETPLDIVVLVDASESVAPRYPVVARDVEQLVADSSRNATDTISVITFAGVKPAVVCASTCTATAVSQKLTATAAAGSTPLFDALSFAAQLMSERATPGMRQVLILFSDGDDTISATSPRDALESIVATGAIFYTVDVHALRHDTDGKHWLDQIADATGGRNFPFQLGEADILHAVLADLRASYVVTYQLPSRSAGFHALRILPKHNLNLRFHCRRGYFYEETR
jgi:VWFA-related protein